MQPLTVRLGKLRRALVSGRVGDLRDMVLAQVALVRAQVLLRSVPEGQLVTPEAAAGTPPQLTPEERAICERWNLAVARAARFGVFRPQCLVRAVALSGLLRRHGIRGHRIRIGVRQDGGSFRAHAWVELGQWVLGESREGREPYTPLTDVRVLR